MQKAFALLEQLQDGRVHSGQTIASNLGVTRAAVWNQVKRLQREGVEVHAVSGKGYRLPGGYEFLNEAAIKLALRADADHIIRAIHIDKVADSTNQRLLDLAAEDDIHRIAWLAEYQSQGRGRRGGSWFAPPGSGLCLSLGWRFDAPPTTLSALSLVIGIGLMRALARVGGRDLSIKWPNDVYADERKLAGILIEMRSEFGGPCTVVIGVGINIVLGHDAQARIDQLATDLSTVCGAAPSRNTVAAAILDELGNVLLEFEKTGFDAFREEWRRYDMLANRNICLEMPDRRVVGVARGVGPDGTLLIEHDGSVESFLAGHIVMDTTR